MPLSMVTTVVNQSQRFTANDLGAGQDDDATTEGAADAAPAAEAAQE